MAFIPISQMIRPLSDFYDPVKAEQVRLTQLKIAQEQQAMEEQKALADIYRSSVAAERPFGFDQNVQGMFNLAAGLPAMPQIAAQQVSVPISREAQSQAIGSARDMALRQGNIDLAQKYQNIEDEVMGRKVGGSIGSTLYSGIDAKSGQRVEFTLENGIPVSARDGERVPVNIMPGSTTTIALAAPTIQDIKSAQLGAAEEKSRVTTRAAQEELVPFKTAERQAEISTQLAKEQRQEAAELRKFEREAPSKIKSVLQEERSAFKSEKPVAWYQGAEGAYNQFTASMESAKEALRAGKPRGPGEIGVVFGLMKMMDPATAVRESEIAMTGAARSLWDRISTYTDRLQQGGTNGFTEKELDEYASLVDNLFEEYSKSYDKEVARYRELNSDVADQRTLELYFPASRFSKIKGFGADIEPMSEPTAEPMPAMPPEPTGASTTLYQESGVPTTLDEANKLWLAPGLNPAYVAPQDNMAPTPGKDMNGNPVTVMPPRGVPFEGEPMTAPASATAPVASSAKQVSPEVQRRLELLRKMTGGR